MLPVKLLAPDQSVWSEPDAVGASPWALFCGSARQRILIALAAHGPLRIEQILRSLELHDYKTITALHAVGLVTFSGIARHARLVSLNEEFPAFIELMHLLSRLGDIYGVTPLDPRRIRRTVAGGGAIHQKPDMRALERIFGARYATKTLYAIFGCDSRGTSDAIGAVLRMKQRSICRQIRHWENLGIVRSSDEGVVMDESWPAFHELSVFLSALMDIHPELRYSLGNRARRVPRPRRVGTRLDWSQSVRRADMPIGTQLSTDGSPLLFGTDVKRRLLCTLAENGPLRPVDLVRTASASKEVLPELIRRGIIINYIPGRGGNMQVVDINPGFVAYRELLALLRKLSTRFAVGSAALESDGRVLPERPSLFPVARASDQFFGGRARTISLLTVSVSGGATTGQIVEMARQSDRGETMRALQMWRNFGIVRKDERGRWILDSDWFGFSELRDLLDAILRSEPRYSARVAAIEGTAARRTAR